MVSLFLCIFLIAFTTKYQSLVKNLSIFLAFMTKKHEFTIFFIFIKHYDI